MVSFDHLCVCRILRICFYLEIDSMEKFYYKKNPYIPLTKTPEIYDYGISDSVKKVNDFIPLEEEKQETNEVDSLRADEFDNKKIIRLKRSEGLSEMVNNETKPAEILKLSNQSNDQWKAISSSNVITNVLPIVNKFDDIKIIHEKPAGNIPHFHVTYWMFYPFSQGKTVCTLNLGPLGPIPIPLVPIFNICLGTKKEFGSHVGDWEHMSLFFRGRMEPDVRFKEFSLTLIFLIKKNF